VKRARPGAGDEAMARSGYGAPPGGGGGEFSRWLESEAASAQRGSAASVDARSYARAYAPAPPPPGAPGSSYDPRGASGGGRPSYGAPSYGAAPRAPPSVYAPPPQQPYAPPLQAPQYAPHPAAYARGPPPPPGYAPTQRGGYTSLPTHEQVRAWDAWQHLASLHGSDGLQTAFRARARHARKCDGVPGARASRRAWR
jgi:hypothetical protein